VLVEVTVSVECNPPMVGTPVAGEKAQVMPTGWPVQLSDVEVLKPLSAVSVTGTATALDCPAGGCGMVIAPVPVPSMKSLMLTVNCAIFDCAELVPATCTV